MFFRQTSRATWFVNAMDRVAKSLAGMNDPIAWLDTELARRAAGSKKPEFWGPAFRQEIIDAYERRLANRAKKLASESEKGSCQVCGRRIGTKAGVIAHHGYQRPGQGWQTASCFGARYRAYEEASDALPPYIAMVRDMMKRSNKKIKALRKSPPDEYRIKHPFNVNKPSKPDIVIPRPAGFDPVKTEKSGVATRGSYEANWLADIGQATRNYNDQFREIIRAERRLADWKDPRK